MVAFNTLQSIDAFREEANQIVRTLLAYGYNLEPPTSEMGESSLRGKTGQRTSLDLQVFVVGVCSLLMSFMLYNYSSYQ